MIATIPTQADLDNMTWPELKTLARESGVPVARRPRKLIAAELAQVLKSPLASEPEPESDDPALWLHYPPGVRRGKGHWQAAVAAHVPTTIFCYNPAGAHACSFYESNSGMKMDHRKHAQRFVDLMEG